MKAGDPTAYGEGDQKVRQADQKAWQQQTNNVVAQSKYLLATLTTPDADGSRRYDGKTYAIEAKGNDLKVEAKDGRGDILKVEDGQVVETGITSTDANKFSSFVAKVRDAVLHQGQNQQPPAQAATATHPTHTTNYDR